MKKRLRTIILVAAFGVIGCLALGLLSNSASEENAVIHCSGYVTSFLNPDMNASSPLFLEPRELWHAHGYRFMPNPELIPRPRHRIRDYLFSRCINYEINGSVISKALWSFDAGPTDGPSAAIIPEPNRLPFLLRVQFHCHGPTVRCCEGVVTYLTFFGTVKEIDFRGNRYSCLGTTDLSPQTELIKGQRGT